MIYLLQLIKVNIFELNCSLLNIVNSVTFKKYIELGIFLFGTLLAKNQLISFVEVFINLKNLG